MKAILIGATGLVGNLILNELLNDSDFSEVRIFVRKTTGSVRSLVPAGCNFPPLKRAEEVLSFTIIVRTFPLRYVLSSSPPVNMRIENYEKTRSYSL